MGIYDVPAMIDYITNKTGYKKISYIGHSQGTTQMFAGMSMLPEYYTNKLNGFIGLGPVTSLNNMQTTFLKYMAEYRIDSLFNLLGINEILPSPESVHKFTTLLCEKLMVLCNGLLELISDSNFSDDNQDRFLVFIGHFPSGASLQTLKHFAEIIRSRKFIRYDNSQPYQLDNIKDIPIALFVGKDDKLSTLEDSRIIRNIFLHNSNLHFYKEYDKMGHATFFLNKVNEYVDDVVRCLYDFNSSS